MTDNLILERTLWEVALSLPCSFPIKAFKYLNRHANEFFSGKAESAVSFFGGSGCFHFVCFGGLCYFLVRQHIMDLFSAILSALAIGFLELEQGVNLGNSFSFAV